MNTIPSESDSNAILDRLLSGAGLHRDAQLAALLGVSPQAVSQARRKRKIPEGWVVKVSQQCGLSMDWLMFGKGDESTPVASHAPVASSISQASTPAGAAVPDLDLLCIPLVAASLSAGVGSLQTEADVLDYFAFRSDWLCRKGNPDKMVLMKVYGDSMEPEICHGDRDAARSSDASPQPQRALRAHRSGSARRHGRVRPHHRQGYLVVSRSLRNREDWGKGGENFLKKVLSSLPQNPHPPSLKDF